MQWFEVDRKGLAQLLERKGKEFVLFELIQNAWDENTTEVRVQLERIPNTRYVNLVVRDDNPEGFKDLAHAFTLFAESAKKGSADKRGRFNLGEKLVLALCEEARISSTKGTVEFNAQGRQTKRVKTERGSVFSGRLKMTNEELQRCEEAVRSLIPPPGIATWFNEQRLAERAVKQTVEATLATEIADAEGHLRTAQRKTKVHFLEPLEGEVPMLYEMGIPVVATDGRWHLDVQQKVPLGMDRDNVPPAYLAKVRALAVEALREELTSDDANAAWVREAFQRHGSDMDSETVTRLTALRFGEKAVAYDPSDPEANSLAVAKGFVVVHGGHLSRDEWDAVRRVGALLPAGRVTPSPKPFSEDGAPQKLLDESKWTEAMHRVVGYSKVMAQRLLGCDIEVRVVSDVTWWPAATYGGRVLTFNLGKLGHRWFDGPLARINSLLIHEFGHHFSGNHLSAEYHDALTSLAGKMVQLALEEPELFKPLRS